MSGTEQAKLAAIIRPMLPSLVGELSDRWASEIADAICDSGQWVPRPALNAATARLDAVLAVHQRDREDRFWCECGEPYDCCPTVKAVALGTLGGDS